MILHARHVGGVGGEACVEGAVTVEDRQSLREMIMSLKEALSGFIDNISLPAIFSRKPENLKDRRRRIG